MRCRGTRRLLLAALDGEITAAERQSLDAHMSGCKTCRAAAGETARLHHALGALPEATVVPAGLEQATLRRVRGVLAEQAEDSGFQVRRSWWWMAPPLAAVLAGIVVWRTLPAEETPAPREVVALRPAPAPVRAAAPPAPATAGAQDDVSSPPPQVAEALGLFLEMPILENMEKLQNFDSIRTVDVGEDGAAEGGRG